ncbi:cyclic nucleotide-binding domain-containing protein [Magnetospirillum sp. 64-120]|uniref:cyclic nucleotide-binding domain-containing protein n=1 Tax=Magnetospirillum sp. 64-120 TaxID=1895778 RepID=UPI00092C3E1D|nr:cyclic nucleotide-binding domain-containing protein [Magnetospirillum sp. 64-120]OJX67244.1 MAG: cAMP-binding protein [Magnetospirillum sp. 64-120]
MAVNNVLERRFIAAGETIFKEGDSGSVAYIVQSGMVELWCGRTCIAELGENAIFGEMALIDGAPRMATAKARTDINVIILPRAVFEGKLEGVDPFVIKLIGILINNVRNFAKMVG